MAQRPYYEALGQGCDAIVRCKDCQVLVLEGTIKKLGSCVCGNRRVGEVRTLSEQEYADIQSGKIDFPYRAEFLKEFAGVDIDV